MIFVSLLSLSLPGLSKPTAWGSFQKCNHSNLLFIYATINNKGSLEQTLHFPRLLDNQCLSLLTSQVNNLCITTHAWAGPTFLHRTREIALLRAHHHRRQTFELPTSDTDHTDATARFAFQMESKNPLCFEFYHQHPAQGTTLPSNP